MQRNPPPPGDLPGGSRAEIPRRSASSTFTSKTSCFPRNPQPRWAGGCELDIPTWWASRRGREDVRRVEGGRKAYVEEPSTHHAILTHRSGQQCDKKTPFCSQCVAAGLLCEGYARHHSVWINSTDGANRRYAGSSKAPRMLVIAAPAIALHDSLAVTARDDRYVGLYLAAFLPNGRLFSLQASRISSAGWLRHHDALCRSEKALRFITLAHGLSMLATRDHDSQLKLKGFEAHRMALQEMRTALQQPHRATGMASWLRFDRSDFMR